jgi:2-C-methyl-D-erythritol 2,4-cyclodiphosphate synthase
MKIRVGNGFDFHRIESGNSIVLAGINIKCPFKIVAHSDGDIILHTVVDAILGALALGDIGTFFPDTDPQWQNQSSVIFLNEAIKLMKEKSFEISNLDVTMICEVPKIKPLKDILVNNLAQLIQASEDQISIKATTTEKMGFLGRGEGIGCFATVCLVSNI